MRGMNAKVEINQVRADELRTEESLVPGQKDQEALFEFGIGRHRFRSTGQATVQRPYPEPTFVNRRQQASLPDDPREGAQGCIHVGLDENRAILDDPRLELTGIIDPKG